ncbi:MAG: DUF2127 domain-containing protein [Deltaproteobacteria bacterium]|nr:DUF2127 domain-containing protein [Deltaproteobacteria bacterium]
MTERKGHAGFLKLIIVYKTVMGGIGAVIAISYLELADKDLVRLVTRFANRLHLDMDSLILKSVVRRAGTLSIPTVTVIMAVILAFGVLNLVEAVGLHWRQRWAEWLTILATGAFIPFEAYTVIHGMSAVKAAILVLNCVIVYYLASHKELFKGIGGGGKGQG